MKKKFFILLLIFICLFSSISVFASKEKVITFVTVNWAPFYSDKLPNNGPLPEIATKAFKKSGYNLKILFMPWARAVLTAQMGKYDGLFGAFYNINRTKFFEYSDSLFTTKVSLITNRHIVYNGLQSIKRYKIGVIRGFVNSSEFDGADYLNKLENETLEVNIAQLLVGKLDIIVSSQGVFKSTLKSEFPSQKLTDFKFLEPPLFENKLFLCFSLKNPKYEEYVKAFNKGLKEIMEDGTYDKIIMKHHL